MEDFEQGNDTGVSMSREVAEDNFDLMCKAARIKWDRYRETNGKKDADEVREKLVYAIEDGEITISSDGWPTVHGYTQSGKQKDVKITHRPFGAERLMSDRVPEGKDVAKMYAVIGKFTGVSPADIASLEETDLRRVESLSQRLSGMAAKWFYNRIDMGTRHTQDGMYTRK
jgi:hypothetical protein